MAEIISHVRQSVFGGLHWRNGRLFLSVGWWLFVVIGFGSMNVQAQELSESYRNALVAYKTGHFDEAAKEIEKSIAESPKESRPLFLRGRIRIELKLYSEAEKDLQAALVLPNASKLIHYYLGELYYVQRNFTEAHTYFTMYHDLVPTDPDGVLKLVYCAIGEQSLGEAARLTHTLNLQDEKNPSAYFAKAALAWADQQGKPESSSGGPSSYLEQAELLYGRMVYHDYLPDYLFLISRTK